MTTSADAASTTLLLFTGSYPYEAALEDTFVVPELPFLAAAFDRVVIIPTRRGGRRAAPPPELLIEESLAQSTESLSGRIRGVLTALGSTLLWREFLQRPAALLRVGAFARLVGTVARAQLTHRWMQQYVRQNRAPIEHLVAYTFWCDATTTGLALMKSKAREMVLVSRAHGADLYADRYQPAYFPARTLTLARLNALFPDSEAGVRYISERYRWFSGRCEVARMGVADPGFVSAASSDEVRVVVSCSRIMPLKRVDLIGRSVGAAARLRPDLTLEWHHFGEGEDRDRIEAEARASMPSNATATFHGFDTVTTLMRFYETHPVDVFVNASSSEGTPVAIMEATSCGIPIVATAVGGNTEIVSSENGETVAPDASADEIGAAIVRVAAPAEVGGRLRDGSRRVWQEKYDAATNYVAFANRISELLRGSRGDRLEGQPLGRGPGG
jgi:glycosyltransferase involved in cell wall biosynthesis